MKYQWAKYLYIKLSFAHCGVYNENINLICFMYFFNGKCEDVF